MSRKNPHPHVVWRDGRPRFSPGKELRPLGYKGKDLRHEDRRWFTRGEAVDWSDRFQQELRERRAAEKKRAASPAPARAARRSTTYTIARMVEDWQRSPRWRPADGKGGKRLSENSRRDYLQKLRVLEKDHPLIWNAPARLVSGPILYQAYEKIWMARGLATARGTMLALSSAFSWAIRAGKVKRATNPAQRLGMEVPEPRIRVATRKELSALVATADALGRPEIGDMIMLGVWTGQRQADRRELLAGQKIDGRRVFRQGKTGAIVWIREAPELEARIEAAASRRAAAKAEALLKAPTPEARRKEEERFAHVVLNERFDERPGFERRTWQPFSKYHYSHVFAEIRAAAVAGIPAEGATAPRPSSAAPAQGQRAEASDAARERWIVEPCPSLADFKELDLRDTAVTWMALAGATIPEIISVTGHTAESATQILKHYLARHPEMADSAIGKMIAWYEGNGETEFGL